MNKKLKVDFVCIHNSYRSQIAKAFESKVSYLISES